jgi:hypothetical protein
MIIFILFFTTTIQMDINCNIEASKSIGRIIKLEIQHDLVIPKSDK